MANKILNNVDHKDLKVDIRPQASDRVNRARVLSSEYADLHKIFPILFTREPESGEWMGHAILGFEKDENLFLDEDGWRSDFLPAALARGPFSIGYANPGTNDAGGDSPAPMIMVDEDDPRCGAEAGEAVFLEFGGESPYLEHIKKVLGTIDNGLKADETFFALLNELELLEPVAINVTLSQQKQVSFKNYHTINKDKLAGLDGEALVKLNSGGFLGLIYFASSSLGNFQKLIEMKNAALDAV